MMSIQNKYSYRSRISEAKFREIIKLFSVDLDATQISHLSGLNRNTINRYLGLIRQRIVEHCQEESPFSGEIEVDESWFGARRVKGKRGRGAFGKTIVFGVLKRGGKVYTEIVPDCSKLTLLSLIRGRVSLDSVIHSDSWRGYDGLVHMGYAKHYRVNHGQDEFVRGKAHINGIEGFWGFAKARLARFRGMHRSTFLMHLKECEFRFNNRKLNLYKKLLTLCRNPPLN